METMMDALVIIAVALGIVALLAVGACIATVGTRRREEEEDDE